MVISFFEEEERLLRIDSEINGTQTAWNPYLWFFEHLLSVHGFGLTEFARLR
jgi:hypothetical protein